MNGQSRYGTSTGLPHASLELRWRTCTDFTVRWGCLAAVGIASAVGLRVSGVSVVTSSLVSQSEWPATILAFACAYSLIGARIPRFAVPIAITSDFLLSVAQLLAAIIVLLPLSYLAAVPALPLIDSELAKLDASLFGFDWQSATGWIVRYPLLERILAHAYASFTYQAAAVLFIGSIARPADRNGDLIWSFVIAGLLTCAVFVFTPAIGNVGHLGQGYVMALNEISEWSVDGAGLLTRPRDDRVSIVPHYGRGPDGLRRATQLLGLGDLHSSECVVARSHASDRWTLPRRPARGRSCRGSGACGDAFRAKSPGVWAQWIQLGGDRTTRIPARNVIRFCRRGIAPR